MAIEAPEPGAVDMCSCIYGDAIVLELAMGNWKMTDTNVTIKTNDATAVIQTDTEKVADKKKAGETEIELHPIAKAMDRAIHGFRDIEECMITLLPISVSSQREQQAKLRAEVDEINGLFKSKDEKNQLHAVRMTLAFRREVERFRSSQKSQVLARSLFITIFSIFDTFTSDLIRALFNRRPELFNTIAVKVDFSELLLHDSLGPIKEKILEDEIESLRREGYTDQFKKLEKLFGINTLRDFPEWGAFIESAQRRNLLVHCDGVVSNQYLAICADNNYKVDNVKIGDRLGVSSKYMVAVVERMIKISTMLGQTLWRKILPDEKERGIADSHLNAIIYNFLSNERWCIAEELGSFACGKAILKNSAELSARISIVNLAIALKFGGKPPKAVECLDKYDWSANVWDLQLAHKVLLEDFDGAAGIMEKIGGSGQLVSEVAYHSWPLFRDFRETNQFATAYRKIYGRDFSRELQKELIAETEELTQV